MHIGSPDGGCVLGCWWIGEVPTVTHNGTAPHQTLTTSKKPRTHAMSAIKISKTKRKERMQLGRCVIDCW